MSGPGQQNTRYEVIIQEDPTTGDLLMPIPPILLEQMGWKEGDDIEFAVNETGNYILQKASK